MRHNYSERRQKRLDHSKDQAEKNRSKSIQLYENAQKLGSIMPFGQPILVGHHSEKSHRSLLNKIHNGYGKAFEAQDKAKYYDQKADTIENNDAISSDDPEAIAKLKEHLASLWDSHAFIKASNPLIKFRNREKFLQLKSATPEMWTELTTPNAWGQFGFASYALSYKLKEIRRIEARIKLLETQAKRGTTQNIINGITIIENAEANRVQLLFQGKPAEDIRKRLKNSGFRWCPSESAWQRQLTPHAVCIATNLLNSL